MIIKTFEPSITFVLDKVISTYPEYLANSIDNANL